MKMGILLLDTFFVFMATFLYCSFKISSKEAREEYEEINY